MTEQEFVEKINGQYQKSSLLMEGDEGYDILRGTAHSVSGYMEDVFALYMAKRINRKDFQFLVDKLISCKLVTFSKAITFKPDLAIIDKGILTHYFDLKTNLGWNRSFEGFLIQKNDLIQKIKGKKGQISFPYVDENNKAIIQEVSFDNDLKYKVIVFNGWNINQSLLAEHMQTVSELQNVEMYVLNTWDVKSKTLKLNYSAFADLY